MPLPELTPQAGSPAVAAAASPISVKQVLVRPSTWNNRPNNDMFRRGYGFCGAYRRAFALWQELAAANGFELNTWDLKPLEEADVVWFIDMPAAKREVAEARKKAKRAVFVLQVFESPILGPHFCHRKNHELFDAVLTYDRAGCDESRYFLYCLPNTPEFPKCDRPFADRKVLCMLNTNRVEGYFAIRKEGLAGLPVIGKVLGGWRLSLGDLLRPTRGDLYKERRKLARAADLLADNPLDIYGRGWQGEQISWCPLFRNAPYRCARAGAVEDKLDLLAGYRFAVAFENYRGSRYWIGEKLFDALFAGTVPVYLGEERITDFAPAACFVDARDFRSYRELLLYLRDCHESEWQAMRDAGQAFLRSEKMHPFTDGAFAERMVGILKKILSD
jgi:hypothetical protein